MAALNVRSEFDKLAGDHGVIGDPQGKPAYAYLRASTDKQAEDGRTSFPRQIESVHLCGQREGYYVQWDMLYFDDASGFELHRPALDLLVKEYDSAKVRADVILAENIRAIAREPGYQSYLLADAAECGVKWICFDPIEDEIIRLVKGIAQKQAMRESLRYMNEGRIKRAEAGNVTSVQPAIGYRIVKTETTRTYEIDPDRAVVPALIFDSIANKGLTVIAVTKLLSSLAKEDERYLTPRGATVWGESSVVKIIRNPVYMGQYVTNRFVQTKNSRPKPGEPKFVRTERDQSEWIVRSCPAIVDEDTWQRANAKAYKKFGAPNRQHSYLLTGLLVCGDEHCDLSWHGHTDSKASKTRRYLCSGASKNRAYKDEHPCSQRSIHCDQVDTPVIKILEDYLQSPERIEAALRETYNTPDNEDTRKEVKFLETQAENKLTELDRLYKAYMAGAFDEHEYASRKRQAEAERDEYLTKARLLTADMLTPEEIEKRITQHMSWLNNPPDWLKLPDNVIRVAAVEYDQEALIEYYQPILRELIDCIVINQQEDWFRIEGRIGAGDYRLSSGENIPPWRDSFSVSYVLTYSLKTKQVEKFTARFAA